MMIGDRVFREITDNVWNPERRIEEMDATGVSMQALSTAPVMFSYWAKPHDTLDLSRILNDHIAEVVRAHPKRFAGLGTIPLQDVDLAAQELTRCVRELKLRVAFAHGGGAFPGTIGRIDHGFHVRPDLVAIDNETNPRKYLATAKAPARFYVDSLVHDADALKMLIKLFGAERVALGSDYPFPLGETKPGRLVESMKLSAKDRAQLLSGTAREFLGLAL